MKKVVISGMVGNALEWYDYALYGHFAWIISKLFFPSADPYVSLIATFGVFAVGFLMRPVGAIVFGHIGDKMGRRVALTSSIILMAIATGLLAILPTYAQIGIAAPILLVVVRLIQGLSLGGEFSGSIIFITEHNKGKNRSLISSTTFFSAAIGILAGSFVGTVVSQFMTQESFESWGWRIPFVIGVGIGFVGLYIRSKVPESPEYLKAKEEGKISASPLKSAFKNNPKEMLVAIGIYLAVTVPFYTLTVFLNTFMSGVLKYEPSKAMFINTISILVMTFTIPVSGFIADKYGRRHIMLFGCAGIIATAYPCFMMLSDQSTLLYPLIWQMLFAFFIGFFIGPVATVLVDLFPLKTRYTGMSFSYNVSAAIFGGTTPMIATWLIEKTSNNNAPALYVIVCAAATLLTLLFYKDRKIN